MVVVFKFGNEGFDREGSMVVESEGETCETRLIEHDAECLDEFRDMCLESERVSK